MGFETQPLSVEMISIYGLVAEGYRWVIYSLTKAGATVPESHFIRLTFSINSK